MVTTTASRRKCADCGLINFATTEECKRCGASLNAFDIAYETPQAFEPRTHEARAESFEVEVSEEFEEVKPRRGLLKRVAWILSVTCTVIVAWHGSLLLTSEPATMNQRLQVSGAVDVIEH